MLRIFDHARKLEIFDIFIYLVLKNLGMAKSQKLTFLYYNKSMQISTTTLLLIILAISIVLLMWFGISEAAQRMGLK